MVLIFILSLSPHVQAFREDDIELFKIVASCGADINTLYQCEAVTKSVLHEAVDDAKLDWIAIMLECGVDLNIRTSKGETAGNLTSYYSRKIAEAININPLVLPDFDTRFDHSLVG